jgi:SAM-dependent methyltransferase
MRHLLCVSLLALTLPACSPRVPESPSPVIPATGPMRDSLNYHRGRYNRVYSDPAQTTFADRPSEFFVQCLRSLPRAPSGQPRPRAIDLGAGNGRNTFAAAEAGYAVTAIDIAAAGLDHIRTVAAASHYSVEVLEADAYEASFQPRAVDLVIAIYFNLPADMSLRLREAIKPGGAIIVEGYLSQVMRTDLERQFAGWEIITSETTDVIPDWSWGKDKKAAPVARFFARKPERCDRSLQRAPTPR